MDAEFVRQAVKAGGTCTTRHKNGNIYYLNTVGKMKVDGEWFECVMYHSIKPFGEYCRKIADFENSLTYIMKLYGGHVDKNQCDGCAADMPIKDGIHRTPDGKPFMSCTRNRYKVPDNNPIMEIKQEIEWLEDESLIGSSDFSEFEDVLHE